MKKYAPVLIICYKRPQHLLNLINSLLANEESKETEVYFYIDRHKDAEDKLDNEEVEKICNKNWKFKKTHVIKNLENKGLKRHILDSITEVAKLNSNLIVLEDDIVVSQKFLEYMNFCLDYYKESKVFHINGFNYTNKINNPKKVYPDTLMAPWGWATWSNKWNNFINSDDFDTDLISNQSFSKQIVFNFYGMANYKTQIKDNLNNKINTWAVFWHQFIVINDGVTLSPGLSHTQNLGFDGSGTNSGSKNIFETKLNNNSTKIPTKILTKVNSNLIVTLKWHIKKVIKNRLDYHIFSRFRKLT